MPRLAFGSVLHGEGIGAGVFASEKDAVDEAQDDEERDAGESPGFVAGQQADEEGDQRETGHGDEGDAAAADFVAVMAEDRRAYGTADQGKREHDVEQRGLQRRAQGRRLEVDHGGGERNDGEIGVEHVDEEADEGGTEGSLAGELNHAGGVEIGLESFIDGECGVGHGVEGL
jgi:hypothetical protein